MHWTVVGARQTRESGHVFLAAGPPTAAREGASAEYEPGPGPVAADGGETLRCAALEPTKRFSDRVWALRPDHRLTVWPEVGDGTLKLETFAVRELVETETTNPTCPECGRSMPGAGVEQGFRCRNSSTSAER